MLAACGSPTSTATTAGTLPPPSTIVVTTTTIPRPAPLPLCEPPSYFPTILPAGVTTPEDGQEFAADRYTAIEGSSTVVFVDQQGNPKVVLIRRSLTPDDWAGRTVRIEVEELGDTMPLVPYPSSALGASAGEWNRAAAANNRVQVSLLPDTELPIGAWPAADLR